MSTHALQLGPKVRARSDRGNLAHKLLAVACSPKVPSSRISHVPTLTNATWINLSCMFNVGLDPNRYRDKASSNA